MLGAVILVGMAFVPGFPAVAFLLLAAILGAAGFLAGRRKAAREAGHGPVRRVDGSGAQPSQPKIGSTAQEPARLAGRRHLTPPSSSG